MNPSSYHVKTKACTVTPGGYRWDLYEDDRIVESSSQSFETEHEARANGLNQMQRLISGQLRR
jgi:hypothetical protein